MGETRLPEETEEGPDADPGLLFWAGGLQLMEERLPRSGRDKDNDNPLRFRLTPPSVHFRSNSFPSWGGRGRRWPGLRDAITCRRSQSQSVTELGSQPRPSHYKLQHHIVNCIEFFL